MTRPPRRLPLAVSLAPALLLLAACGSDDKAVTIDTSGDGPSVGEVARAMAGAGTSLVNTDDLPDFVQMYSGGTPVMHMKTTDGDNLGGLFSYNVDAPLEEVVAFHREALKQAGITITTEMAAQDRLTFGGSDAAESKRLLATVSKGEDAVSVSLTYSLPKG